jgi:hypothetical protein
MSGRNKVDGSYRTKLALCELGPSHHHDSSSAAETCKNNSPAIIRCNFKIVLQNIGEERQRPTKTSIACRIFVRRRCS